MLLGVSEFRQQGPAYACGTPTPRRGSTEGLLKQPALDTHFLLLNPKMPDSVPWPIELVLIMPLAAQQRVWAKPLSARAENIVQLLFVVRVSIWHRPRPRELEKSSVGSRMSSQLQT